MIRSFRCRDTESPFYRIAPARFANIALMAQRRLAALDAARKITDLRIPPGNRLEALSADRTGQHSIRMNSQYRICFTWKEGHAHDVEITKHYA